MLLFSIGLMIRLKDKEKKAKEALEIRRFYEAESNFDITNI